MEIVDFVRPRSIDEAYEYLTEKGAFPLGGGAWSRMSGKSVETAVDLSALDLRYINSSGRRIEIGAMTTARDVETSAELQEAFGPLFRNAVAHIAGVQMRNIISVGGTVAGRFGFSDLNTLFLALDAKVVLYHVGEVDFEGFLLGRHRNPLLIEKIVIDRGRGSFQSIRNSRSDLPILNAAAAFAGGSWRIAVGSRPGPARLSATAAKLLGTAEQADRAAIEEAARAAADEIPFRSDTRGTAEYRKSICEVLVRRAITEVVA